MQDQKSENREIAKQLSTYADGITAFAVVQGVGYAFIIAQNVTADCAIKSRWYVVFLFAAVATYGYVLMLRRCHSAEDELIGVPGDRGKEIGAIVPMIRNARVWLIVLVGIGEIAITTTVAFFQQVVPCSSVTP